MNQVATANQTAPLKTEMKRASLIDTMAAHYNMEPALFTAAVRKTAMPKEATNEEFAAFMMVAHEYKLNPFLKELYAFPKKGGGIVPMVSIDGWVNIINSHPLMAGFELESHYDNENKLAAVTCRMHRKDRSLPIVITEYMIECFRNTEPWRQMPSRMLRHKALIQAARYAFGLSGIYDEDEAKDIGGVKDITPTPRPKPSDFVIPAQTKHTQTEETFDKETGEVIETEYGAADAYSEGEKARADGKALSDMPPNLTAFQHLADAWIEGFKSGGEP